ncbi:hypothetical protein ACPV5G_21625, partial [Photobacterium damselae]|uniref:hypothetical protein n=1 Tax=Photobacterium damselae TaxID=38293 RepID=UPI0040675873
HLVESLFVKSTPIEVKQFEQNSLTQALERASSIAKRDNLPPQIQEQITSLLASYQLDQAESEDFNDPILDKAKTVIRSEIDAGNIQLKGIRQAYRQAGITAKEINRA